MTSVDWDAMLCAYWTGSYKVEGNLWDLVPKRTCELWHRQAIDEELYPEEKSDPVAVPCATKPSGQTTPPTPSSEELQPPNSQRKVPTVDPGGRGVAHRSAGVTASIRFPRPLSHHHVRFSAACEQQVL